jgi:hypothetical protein
MIHTSLTDSNLNTFIEKHAKGSLYYSQAWLDLITQIYGYTLIPLTTTNRVGQISGFLPLFAIRSPLTGRRLVSLPFSDFCPLLAEDEASATALVDQAIQLSHEQKASYLELRTGSNALLARRRDLAEGNLYVRWLLPLVADPESVWSGLRKPVQHQVKKSQKRGVQVRLVQTHATFSGMTR